MVRKNIRVSREAWNTTELEDRRDSRMGRLRTECHTISHTMLTRGRGQDNDTKNISTSKTPKSSPARSTSAGDETSFTSSVRIEHSGHSQSAPQQAMVGLGNPVPNGWKLANELHLSEKPNDLANEQQAGAVTLSLYDNRQ